MQRRSFLAAPAAAALLGMALAAPAAAAPAACGGDGFIYPTSAMNVRLASGITFIDFDFAGEHPFCLADGTEVTASIAGHVWERLFPNDNLYLRFAEKLTLGSDELGYAGNASLNGAGWHSHVRTVGPGTGALTGVEGQGSFSPIDPVTGAFSDVISYVYH